MLNNNDVTTLGKEWIIIHAFDLYTKKMVTKIDQIESQSMSTKSDQHEKTLTN